MTTAGAPEAARISVRDEPVKALSARERLELLCDPGSLQIIRSTVLPRRETRRMRAGDGVIAAAGSIGGRAAFCYAQDQTFAGGSLGEAHADTIVRVMELAGRAGAPMIGLVSSGGARMDEGCASLGGYGRIFRESVRLSGRVPQISIVTGVSAGGGAYSPALTDFVAMSRDASMFLTGPGVVREVMGEDVDGYELGGAHVHARNGVCHFVSDGVAGAIRLVRTLLAYLPQRAGEPPPHAPPESPTGADPGAPVPPESRRVYDVRDVVARLVDGGALLEVSASWARNIVVGFARVAGRPVGVVANQPWFLGGVIDANAAQKAARFVRTCNAFGLPLVVLVDTPGFMPGTKQERAGVIRHGAKLLHAFAEAVVPKVTVILRKAYGGGFITMNAKDLGADLALAWPDAQIGVMGPRQAVAIVHRRELAAAANPDAARERLAAVYAAEFCSAAVAARDGLVDELVEPRETRARLETALAALGASPRHGNGPGNIPL